MGRDRPKINTVASSSTSRTSVAADRFRTIGHLVIALVAINGFGTNALARNIPIPKRTLTTFQILAKPVVPKVYVWDHFNRPNASPIGTAVVGGNWLGTPAGWTIATNQAAITALPNASATINVPGVLDGQLDADLSFGSTAEAGLDFLDDGINTMFFLYKKSGATSQVRLYTRLSAIAIPPAPVAIATVNPTTAATVKVVINDATIKLSWNGTVIITYTMTVPEFAALRDPGSNGVGLRAESDALTRFDNFRFQSL